jgi:hypothetical protein
MRQSQVLTEYDPKRGVSVATLAYEYPSEVHVAEHAHGADQLIYAIGGLMEVSSDQSVWLIPPHFALWIPARTQHRIHMPKPVSMRTLYLRKGQTGLGPRCTVLHVTPLLRLTEIVPDPDRSACTAGRCWRTSSRMGCRGPSTTWNEVETQTGGVGRFVVFAPVHEGRAALIGAKDFVVEVESRDDDGETFVEAVAGLGVDLVAGEGEDIAGWTFRAEVASR